MDAFAHCLEAFSAPSYHPMSEGIALEGMRLVKEYLPRAFRDGNDMEARAEMLSAAAMGAVAFQKGLGAIHALSHPAGALYHTHHGLTNAVFMPYVLDFQPPGDRGEDRAARGLPRASTAGSTVSSRYVMRLREELEIPHTIREIGVDDRQFDRMAEMAVADPTAGGNPVELTVAAARDALQEGLFRIMTDRPEAAGGETRR